MGGVSPGSAGTFRLVVAPKPLEGRRCEAFHSSAAGALRARPRNPRDAVAVVLLTEGQKHPDDARSRVVPFSPIEWTESAETIFVEVPSLKA